MIQQRLFALRDDAYAAFMRKLIPTIEPSLVIGVRAPALGKLARELSRSGEAEAFLSVLPHAYLEENLLHASLLGRLDFGFDELLRRVEEFLPHVDNWAVCDTLPPKAFSQNLPAVYARVPVWLASARTYTVRFALVTLLSFFLDDETFDPADLSAVAALRTDDYYINMAAAWYVSYALIKQYERTLPLIEGNILDRWVHNKSIQKAVESYRICDERKAYLKTLRR
jgi:3-methyladenine DNA glycosylase AlkD